MQIRCKSLSIKVSAKLIIVTFIKEDLFELQWDTAGGFNQTLHLKVTNDTENTKQAGVDGIDFFPHWRCLDKRLPAVILKIRVG